MPTLATTPVPSAMPMPEEAPHPVFDGAGTRQAEFIVRVIESSTAVQRRYQFYVWTESTLQALLPHQLALCAAYQRSRRELVFDAFYSVPLASPLLALMANPQPQQQSALLRELQRLWAAQGGRCLVLDSDSLRATVPAEELSALTQAGLTHLLVHGVARPQRPQEIESLFVLAGAGQRWDARHRMVLDLVLPYLHTTYMRVQVNERELGNSAPPMSGNGSANGSSTSASQRPSPITERERQILRWVREGKRNQEIGVLLDISGLTVKNHVQKILRKLNAANRAQAVALAMSRNLL